MKTFSILFAALTLLISTACSTTEKKAINAYQLLGEWVSVSKKPLNNISYIYSLKTYHYGRT